jgi:hypothetical protein
MVLTLRMYLTPRVSRQRYASGDLQEAFTFRNGESRSTLAGCHLDRQRGTELARLPVLRGRRRHEAAAGRET